MGQWWARSAGSERHDMLTPIPTAHVTTEDTARGTADAVDHRTSTVAGLG